MEVSTAVYMDYDNLFRSINESYSQFQTYVVVNKILDSINGSNSNKIQLVKAFCDFNSASHEISDLQKSLVELRHINSIGDGKSNASDIALAIDVIKSLFNTRTFEHYVIVSSDSDMLPLLLELSYQGKKITLCYLESKIKQTYLESLANKVDLLKIEDLLGIETYKPFDIEELKASGIKKFTKYLNAINDLMNDLYVEYGSQPSTVIYQKNLLSALTGQEEFNLQPSDASLIIDYFKKEELIVSAEVKVVIKGNEEKRRAFFINEEKLSEFELVLTNEIKVKLAKANLIEA